MSSVDRGTHSRPGLQSFQRIVARRRILVVAAAIAAVGLATAVTLVLHERDPGPCDAERLEADARALDAAIERWSPHDGRIPDFLTPAASAVWKACGDEMPQEFRWYLDLVVPHSRPPWEREGKRAPDGAVWDPLADVLPGHLSLHQPGSMAGARELGAAFLQRVEAVCPGSLDVAREVVRVDVGQRSAVLFDRCDLARMAWLDRDEFIAANAAPRSIHAVALHDWLLESGVDPWAAKVLSTELVFAFSGLEGPSTGSGWPLLGEQRLPWAHRGDPLLSSSTLLYVTSTEIQLARWDDDEALAVVRLSSDDDLAGVGEIFEAWADEPPVILFADRETPWRLLRTLQLGARTAGIAPLRIAVLVDSTRNPLRTVAAPHPESEIPDATPIQAIVVGSGKSPH